MIVQRQRRCWRHVIRFCEGRGQKVKTDCKTALNCRRSSSGLSGNVAHYRRKRKRGTFCLPARAGRSSRRERWMKGCFASQTNGYVLSVRQCMVKDSSQSEYGWKKAQILKPRKRFPQTKERRMNPFHTDPDRWKKTTPSVIFPRTPERTSTSRARERRRRGRQFTIFPRSRLPSHLPPAANLN